MNSRADSRVALSWSRFIHRKILIRLFLGWLFLSVAIGGVVLWLEVHRIQQFVHELALMESATFSGESAHNLVIEKLICFRGTVKSDFSLY